jgi:hypothetical protein
MAPSIKVGDTIPKGEFGYIPWATELENKASILLHRIGIIQLTLGPIARVWSPCVSKCRWGALPSIYHSFIVDTASKINTETDWKGKKVVLFSVPGAFTVSVHPHPRL